MAEFTLPKNSKIRKGKHCPAPAADLQALIERIRALPH